MKKIPLQIWKIMAVWSLWGAIGWGLVACSVEEEIKGCDFTEKLVSISIDERRILLHDELLLEATLSALQAIVDEEEIQRQEMEALVNEARPSGVPVHHESLSKKGKRTLVKKDLLEKLKSSQDSTVREKWLTLYNHLRWGELIPDRAFHQECEKRTVLKPEDTPYQTQTIESHFREENDGAIGQKNLYYAYSNKAEMDYLNESSNVFRYLNPKTGRGFSTGFFVEDIKNRTEWKIKVGWEAYREPLATRLVWALGFYVDEVFHVRDLRIKFDADLEKLFEAKGRKIEDSLSGIILEDGTAIDFIVTPEREINVSGLYNSYYHHIRYFVFKSVVLERRDPNIVRGSQWSFDALGNPELRAVRMLGLLNFWLGNSDIKFDNNRIFLRCTDPDALGEDVFRSCVEQGDYTYRFVVHDLGLSFAPNPSVLNAPGHELDIHRDADGQVSILSRTRGRDVYAWRQITLQDALAFAERLAQLTENQFRQAAAAAGYPYPALLILVEKLKERRNRFLQAVAEDQYPLFEVDPFLFNASSGTVAIGEQEPLTIPQDDFILSNGMLINDISLGNHGRHAEMIRE